MPTSLNGTVADLAVGRVVHVEGTVVNGILNAKSVEFDDGESDGGGGTSNPPDGAQADAVDGAISAFVSAASFVVHGIAIDASAATFVNGAIGDLANGRIVKVFGTRTGTALTAAKVVFDTGDGSDGGDTEIDDVDGGIVAFTSVASFVVDGVTVDASAATFVNGAATDLAVGKVVKVLGTRTGSSMKATRVTFVGGSEGDVGGEDLRRGITRAAAERARGRRSRLPAATTATAAPGLAADRPRVPSSAKASWDR